MGRIKSFTLIEMIIVVGITGLVLPAIFSIVFVILQQQTKIIRLQEVKRQGDFILSSMRSTIRNNAAQIYSESGFTNERCASSGTTYESSVGDDFFFKDKNGKWFNYYLIDDKISSGSAYFLPTTKIDLTNDKVNVTLFSIKCSRQSDYSSPIITLKVELEYNNQTSTRPEEIASLTYNTNIKLKSY